MIPNALESAKILYKRFVTGGKKKKKKKVSLLMLCTTCTDCRTSGGLRCCLSNLSEMADSDPDYFKEIVTGDESWRFAYDPATKQQSSV